jgi:hypothetical protein
MDVFAGKPERWNSVASDLFVKDAVAENSAEILYRSDPHRRV